MRIPISRLLSIVFIAAMVGFAAQFVVWFVVLFATTTVTYPSMFMHVIDTSSLFGFLALSTVLVLGLAYAVCQRLRSALRRQKAAVAFSVSGAAGPSIAYLHLCSAGLAGCPVENARDAMLGSGFILSGAVFGFVFFTICWQFLHPQRAAS